MFPIVLAVLYSLLLRSSDGMETVKECPKGCNCELTSFREHLKVSCVRPTGVSPLKVDQFSRQLDSLLSDKHTTEHLTSLRITDSPLTSVPASICQLLNLTSLHLDRNRLTELPDNCFTKLTKLNTLSMTENAIVGLQNGLFDGLQNLVSLDLSYNQITFIGLRVFSNSSDLTSLRLLKLWSNKLTSLEPWWYYRCIHGSKTSPVRIVLRYNMISHFTNQLLFNYQCDMKRPSGYLDLGFNQIAHITDVLRGWNITTFESLLCLANHGESWHATYMRVNFGGKTYACDCEDFLFYKMVKLFPNINLLQGVRCSKFLHTYAMSVPLSEFICQITEGCPSSCRCVYRPANVTLHVYCSSTNLTSLPLYLPPLPKKYVRYKLDFSNNKLLQRLEHRSYFVNTTILDVSNCGLTEIDVGLWREISHMKLANFRRNMLQSIPRDTEAVRISTRLLLGGNPWRCSCDNSWIIAWLKSLSRQISDLGDIACGSPSRMYGRNVLKSTEEDFCVDPVLRTLKITLSTVASVAAVLVIAGILLHTQKHRLYKKFKFHPFDRDECIEEGMDYDVFLCCSSEDHNPHAVRILELLESHGYCVCYHERDFMPGSLITDNMGRAIERSKRTVCLLSEHFLQSRYCMTEFDMAYYHNVVTKRKKRLIVLKMLYNPVEHYADDASDKATLRQFLRQYTYIDYAADDWLDKLLYALPLRGLLQRSEQNNDDVPLHENI